MCDTLLATPDSTAERTMLFAKNSDRQRNEAQSVEYFPGADHEPGSRLKCTYLTIPQAPRTHAVLLCRPFWMWGAEMGANEHGVVIGNEGLQARSAAPQQPALTGMDLIRLALERANSAAHAMDVITTLLELHGQGGNGGHLTPVFYNNGFMIADSREAFVLETIGREWLVERVRGVRAMSNRYSIGREADRTSAGLPALVRDSGWSADDAPDYAEAIANPHREHLGNAGARRARSSALLSLRDGRLGVADMTSILRDHGAGNRYPPVWQAEGAVTFTVCMHAGADDRPGQTAGSMVSELSTNGAVHWVTGTAAPCMSIFKPVLIDTPPPPHGTRATDRFDARAFWWRHERLHRAAILGDFPVFLNDIRPERDSLEAHFHARVRAVLNGGSVDERSKVIADCWKEAIEAEDRWHARVAPARSSQATAYVAGWEKMNRLAGLEGSQ
jgi:secernin